MSVPVAFRNAVRDSDLDRTAKLVAFVISTYMDASGECWPSKATISRKASLGAGRRSVDLAVDRLEDAGLLVVARNRKPFHYVAAPATYVHGEDAQDATSTPRYDARTMALSRTDRTQMSHGVRPKLNEDVEDVEPLGGCFTCGDAAELFEEGLPWCRHHAPSEAAA